MTAMPRSALAVLALTALLSMPAASQSVDASKLTGRWSGTGTFFKADLRERLGAVPFFAEFKADRSGTGRVGGATMEKVRVKPSRAYVEVSATLTGAVSSDPALAKHQVVLLITAATDSTLDAEFHLKANAFLDPRMKEGRVTLRRVK